MVSNLFTDRQSRIVSVALTAISLVALVALAVAGLLMVIRFFTFFSGVFMPLAVASILATLMKPYYEWWLARVRHPALSVTAVLVSLVVPLALLVVYFGGLVADQATKLAEEIPALLDRIESVIREKLPLMREHFQEHNLKEKLAGFVRERSALLTGSVEALGQGLVTTGSAVFGTFSALLAWFVMPIYFAFIIQAPPMTGQYLEQHLPFFKPATRADVIYLISEFANIMVAFFRGQILVAGGQGVLYALGFALCGLPHGLLLGLVLGFLNIVPYLGNIVGLAVILPLAWFHAAGGPVLLASVLVVFVLVQMVEAYILTPRIMGKTTGLHPMAIVFAMIFWGTALNGLLGMILAIPLTAFLVVLWRLLCDRYIKEWI